MDYIQRISKYIDRAFAGLRESEQVRELKEELLSDLLERYQQLLQEGHPAAQAYELTISSIGDIYELVDSVAETDEDKIGHGPITGGEPKENESAIRLGTRLNFFNVSIVVLLLFLAFLIYDLLIEPPGPKSLWRQIPLLTVGITAVSFTIFLFRQQQRGKHPLGLSKNSKNLLVLLAVLWAAAFLVCLYIGAKPHLRKLFWLVPILTLVVHNIILSLMAYRAEMSEKSGENHRHGDKGEARDD